MLIRGISPENRKTITAEVKVSVGGQDFTCVVNAFDLYSAVCAVINEMNASEDTPYEVRETIESALNRAAEMETG